MTVVYFSDEVEGRTEHSYDGVTIKASGWAFCYDGDGGFEAFPPSKIDRIVEPDPSDKHQGEKLTSESPHGRI